MTCPEVILDSCNGRRLSAGFSREWPQAIAAGDAERSRRVPVDAGDLGSGDEPTQKPGHSAWLGGGGGFGWQTHGPGAEDIVVKGAADVMDAGLPWERYAGYRRALAREEPGQRLPELRGLLGSEVVAGNFGLTPMLHSVCERLRSLIVPVLRAGQDKDRHRD